MKYPSLPKEVRRTILLIADDPRSYSGVAHVARETILNSAHHYNWVVIAGAGRHHQAGQLIDGSGEFGPDSSVLLYCTDGYGTYEMVDQIIDKHNIDAVMMITDPRWYTYLFQNERDIRSRVPIVYLNIWDSAPYPMYNRSYYESCDTLLCISKLTKNVVTNVLGRENVIDLDKQ